MQTLITISILILIIHLSMQGLIKLIELFPKFFMYGSGLVIAFTYYIVFVEANILNIF